MSDQEIRGTIKKSCPRCAAIFGYRSAGCWCNDVRLSVAKLNRLSDNMWIASVPHVWQVLNHPATGLNAATSSDSLSPRENDRETLHNTIFENVEISSTVLTDEHIGCRGLSGQFYDHQVVNHSGGEYKRGVASTNSIRSVWALLKRGICGTYHQVSAKHLTRYVDKVSFRLNEGDVKRHTLDRLDSFVAATDGKRLTYARLIA
jgi:hypothetical protein